MNVTRRLSRSGAPPLHIKRAVEEPQSVLLKTVIMQHLKHADGVVSRGGIAVLLGNRGCGKTQVAVCIMCNALAGWLRTVRYTTACEMFGEIKNSYGGGDTQAVMDRLTKPYLLVIDDCHERSDTAHEDHLLMQIMDRRYRHQRGTLLISNQKRDAFAKSMGPGITSRIWEHGVVIELPEHDFRRSSDSQEKR